MGRIYNRRALCGEKSQGWSGQGEFYRKEIEIESDFEEQTGLRQMVRGAGKETFQSRVILGSQGPDRNAGCDLIRRRS